MKKETKGKTLNKISQGLTALGISVLGTNFCFADDILSNVETLIKTYYDRISGIAIGGGLLCAVIAIGVMVISPSDRGSETGKRWLIRILLGIALLLSIGGIYSLIQSMTAGTTLDINTILR